MIIKSINTFDGFRSEFIAYGRGDQFSYNALKVLFDWYEELSDGMGGEYELDVIGICCEWSEYDRSEFTDEELEELENRAYVIYVDNNTLLAQE